MSEMETQRGDSEIGRCHVCGDIFPHKRSCHAI